MIILFIILYLEIFPFGHHQRDNRFKNAIMDAAKREPLCTTDVIVSWFSHYEGSSKS